MMVIAHNIRSLHNVGSIFRSCDAFGVEKLFLTGITGTPPRKEIAKVALGSEHHLNWEYVENVLELIARLKADGMRVVALDNNSRSRSIDQLHSVGENGLQEKFVIILGSEVQGIEPDVLAHCHEVVEIPMVGRKQSLNVSVATGIALFALTRSSR